MHPWAARCGAREPRLTAHAAQRCPSAEPPPHGPIQQGRALSTSLCQACSPAGTRAHPSPHPPCAPSPGSHSAQETHSLQDPFSRALGPGASVQQGWTRSLECQAHKSRPHSGDSGGGCLHPCEHLLDPRSCCPRMATRRQHLGGPRRQEGTEAAEEGGRSRGSVGGAAHGRPGGLAWTLPTWTWGGGRGTRAPRASPAAALLASPSPLSP